MNSVIETLQPTIADQWSAARPWITAHVNKELSQHPEIDSANLYAIIDVLQQVSQEYPVNLTDKAAFDSWLKEAMRWAIASHSWTELYQKDIERACKSVLGRFGKHLNWTEDTVHDLVQDTWLQVFRLADVLIALPEAERKKQILKLAYDAGNQFKDSETVRRDKELSIGDLKAIDSDGTYDWEPNNYGIQPELERESPWADPFAKPKTVPRVTHKQKTKVAVQARTDGKFQLLLAERPHTLEELVHVAATREQAKDRVTARAVTFSLKRIHAVLVNGCYELPEPYLSEARTLRGAFIKFEKQEQLRELERESGQRFTDDEDEDEGYLN